MMKIYLCDHKWDDNKEPPSKWHEALTVAFRSLFCSSEASNDNEAPVQHSAYGNTEAIIFAHTEHAGKWEEKADMVNVLCQIVLIRTDGKEPGRNTVKSNLHGCYWSPIDFSALVSEQPSRVTEFIRQVATKPASEIDWNLLQPDPVEPILAAKLLVEAKAYGDRELHGIKIGLISDELFNAAQAVVKRDSIATAELQTSIESLKDLLNEA